MKRTSLVKCDLESLKKIGPDAIILAKEEGLGAHALSISSRIRNDWIIIRLISLKKTTIPLIKENIWPKKK